jgi:hypothetical protein
VNKNPRNPGVAYLPERYKQQIEAKKRRRFLKKVAIMCVIVVSAIVVYLVLSGVAMSSPYQSSASLPESTEPAGDTVQLPSSTASPTALTPNMTGNISSDLIIGTGVPALSPIGILALNDAITYVRQDYPEPLYSAIGVNLTDQYTNSSLYEFTIKQTNVSSAEQGFSVFIDAHSGDPYIPGQEISRISAIQAKNHVQETFLVQSPDSVRVKYDNGPDSARAWLFTVRKENRTIISGSLDPDTGHIASFSRHVQREGRQAEPNIDSDAAQAIADRYIIDRNGAPLPIKLRNARYEPLEFPDESVAGHYVFEYNRIVQDIPCDYDGFTVSVDSVTGEITDYNRRWNSPDNAFSVAVDPLVKRYEALYLIQQKAEETFPESATGLRIISADIRWKDMLPPNSMPRPGSIPISWKIQFDDDLIRAKQWPVPATGWIDASTGEILDFYYRH